MFHRLKPLVFAASLIFTIVFVSAFRLPTVRAANVVISDASSCIAAGGSATPQSNTCTFYSPYTVASGETFSTTDWDVSFFPSLTNNGSMTIDGVLSLALSTHQNKGTINFTDFLSISSNTTLINYGSLNGGYGIVNNGTIYNCGIINAEILVAGTIVQSCPPTATPTATFTASNTATFTRTPTPTASNTATFTPTNTLIPPTSTYTNTPSNTPVPPTATYTNTPSNTPVPPTSTSTNTPTNTATNTATNTLTPSNTPTSTFTPTPSGFAKAQFNHGNEISVTKSERPSISFQYGATTGLPLSNPRLECAISGQATFVTPVGNNGFTTVTATATTLNFSGRAPLKNGQNYTATFKVNPGPTVGQISTLTCTLLGDNFAAVGDTLNIRVR